MSGLAHYSPEHVTVLLGGVYPIDGFVDGSFVSIKKDSPNFTTKVTADGSVSRTRNANDVYSVTITLASFANSNKILSAIAELDHRATNARLPLMIKDSKGSTTFFSPEAWVSEPTAVEFGIDITERQWTFTCPKGVLIAGGNEGGILDGVSAELASVGFLGLNALGFL